MSEQDLEPHLHSPRLFFFGYQSEDFKSSFWAQGLFHLEFADKLPSLKNGDWLPSVLFLNLSHEKLVRCWEELAQLRHQLPSLSIVVQSDGLEPDQVMKISTHLKPFIIVKNQNEIESVVEQALRRHERQLNYFQNLKKLKLQNQKLESLNLNLEHLVYERTKKEFAASQQAEESTKKVQNILSFIKTVIRGESIEELMLQLRDEFRKTHGMMPPVLHITRGNNETRLFYFQSKQLVEKRIEIQSRTLSSNHHESISKSKLTHWMGRPVGHLVDIRLELQSPDLSRTHATLVFEHSLDPNEIDEFKETSQAHWPIFAMALENALLRESHHQAALQWAQTFNSMSDPILIIGSDFNVSLSNRNRSKPDGGVCYEKFAQRESPCPNCPIQETFRDQTPRTSDVRMGKKVFRVHSYPIQLEGEESVRHVINQYVDVTQTIDLRSRVVQGEKMAAVGLLAGNIAHELNNPLTGIDSLSQLLLEDFDPESNSAKDLTEIKDAAKRCQRIIHDLLDFSETGSEANIKRTDLNDVVRKTFPLLKMAMRSLNTELICTDAALWIRVNPQLIQQVIFNLINNACQAMGSEGHLRVQTEVVDQWVQFSVRDTGPGIPEEIRKSIFDAFFTTKDSNVGTGLGLSLSRQIVQGYGGHLELNDDYKDGTEFVVKLPREGHEGSSS